MAEDAVGCSSLLLGHSIVVIVTLKRTLFLVGALGFRFKYEEEKEKD